MTILDSKIESQLLELSDIQIQEIEASRKDVAEGRFIEQSDLDTMHLHHTT